MSELNEMVMHSGWELAARSCCEVVADLLTAIYSVACIVIRVDGFGGDIVKSLVRAMYQTSEHSSFATVPMYSSSE